MANQATPRTPRNKTNSKPKLKILQQLDFLFESLENRWNNGLNSFQQQLDQYKNHNRLGIELKKNDIINTPIHKIITINEEYIYLLLDTIFMQRLRGIKHQGLAYLVYPTATHSRFEHSLGAYKITIDIINAIKENPRLYGKHYNYNDIELCIAALLHDIGHYPFSHLGEHAFDDFIYQHKMNYEINNILPDNHEVRTANIIRGGDIFEDLNPKNNPFKDLFDLIGQFNNNIEINVENIANLIEGKEKIEGLSNKDLYDKSNRIKIGHLINGPLDVDKLDYILRESYFTGTPFGSIDIHRIVKGYGVGDIKLTENDSPIPNQLVYNKKMLPSVIQMYIARAFDYSQISYHRTLRIADTTLKTIIDITMNEFINFMEKNGYNDQIEEYLTQILKHFKLMEDRDFLCFIEIMISLSTIAKNLFYNLVNRTFNKQISYINRIEKEKIDPRILTKLEIKENSPLKLHIPTKSFAKISKKSNLSDIFMRYWNDPVDKEIKSNVEKFLAELKPENNVILINTFDFAFNEEIKRENIYEKVRDIYICEDFSNPKIERVYESSKNNFIGFLYDLEEKNSNVIFAFDNNRRKTIFDNYVKDEKFLYNFIYLVLAYNGRI